MSNRTTTFIGAYVGADLKQALQAEARGEHRNLSQQMTRIVELHLKGKNAERESCAAAICEQCRNGVPLIYSLTRKPHRFAQEYVTGWIHGYTHPPSLDCTFEECAAAAIHERSRIENCSPDP